ncbi:hypothetical protein BAE44_0013278, partial [Dichanthelium oligosanthes]
LFCSYCSSIAGHFSKMACSIGSSGDSKVTRVLFCRPYFPASTNYTKEYLQSYQFIEVDEVGLEQVPDVIQNYHICLVKNHRIDSDIIAKAIQMKIIMQYGVGLEGVDANAATEHKIKVARIPGSLTGNVVSCTEMAIYLTLGVLQKQKLMDTAVNKKDLGSPTGETIFGKTVGIVDNMFLSVMKKGSCLVNIARGRLLDYKVVFDHLESGHLGGLGIDVTWTEPFDPNDPILKFSNVIITPHVAGVTEYSYRTMAKVVGDVALQLHSGEPFTRIEFVN